MKLLSTILATTGLVVSSADPSTGLRTLGKKQGRSRGPPGAPGQCTPQALEGVWAHMSQGETKSTNLPVHCHTFSCKA